MSVDPERIGELYEKRSNSATIEPPLNLNSEFSEFEFSSEDLNLEEGLKNKNTTSEDGEKPKAKSGFSVIKNPNLEGSSKFKVISPKLDPNKNIIKSGLSDEISITGIDLDNLERAALKGAVELRVISKDGLVEALNLAPDCCKPLQNKASVIKERFPTVGATTTHPSIKTSGFKAIVPPAKSVSQLDINQQKSNDVGLHHGFNLETLSDAAVKGAQNMRALETKGIALSHLSIAPSCCEPTKSTSTKAVNVATKTTNQVANENKSVDDKFNQEGTKLDKSSASNSVSILRESKPIITAIQHVRSSIEKQKSIISQNLRTNFIRESAVPNERPQVFIKDQKRQIEIQRNNFEKPRPISETKFNFSNKENQAQAIQAKEGVKANSTTINKGMIHREVEQKQRQAFNVLTSTYIVNKSETSQLARVLPRSEKVITRKESNISAPKIKASEARHSKDSRIKIKIDSKAFALANTVKDKLPESRSKSPHNVLKIKVQSELSRSNSIKRQKMRDVSIDGIQTRKLAKDILNRSRPDITRPLKENKPNIGSSQHSKLGTFQKVFKGDLVEIKSNLFDRVKRITNFITTLKERLYFIKSREVQSVEIGRATILQRAMAFKATTKKILLSEVILRAAKIKKSLRITKLLDTASRLIRIAWRKELAPVPRARRRIRYKLLTKRNEISILKIKSLPCRTYLDRDRLKRIRSRPRRLLFLRNRKRVLAAFKRRYSNIDKRSRLYRKLILQLSFEELERFLKVQNRARHKLLKKQNRYWDDIQSYPKI